MFDASELKSLSKPQQFINLIKMVAASEDGFSSLASEDGDMNNSDGSASLSPYENYISSIKPYAGKSKSSPLHDDWWRVPWDKEPTYAKCPFRGRCLVDGCTNITEGPACGLCKKNYFQEVNGDCVICEQGTVLIRGGIISGVLVGIFIILFSFRHKIAQMRQKYASAWRDITRILTINLSYAQVSSSLPN